MYRSIILILILLPGFQPLYAQKISSEQTNRITHNLFEYGQWKSLIVEGKRALNEDIEFDSLHIRMGIAYFELHKYMLSIPHLNKAFLHKPGDTILLEYLYFALRYANREMEAAKLLEDNRLVLNRLLEKEFNKKLPGELYFTSGSVISSNEKTINKIDIDGENNFFGYADPVSSIFFLNAGISHKISPVVNLHFAYNHIKVNRKEIAFKNNIDLRNEPHNMFQREYYLGTDILLKNSYYLKPAIHYLHVAYQTAGFTGKFNSLDAAIYKPSDISINSMVYFLGLSKYYNWYNLGVGLSFSNLNNNKQYQAGINWTTFPTGNLNFYTICNFTVQYQEKGRFIADIKAGVSILPKLWLEGFYNFGERTNFVSDNGYTAYNMQEVIKSGAGANILMPLWKNLELDLYYQFMIRENYYTTYKNSTNFEHINYQFKTHSIIGGIKWTF